MPLVLVVSIAITIALQNIHLNTYYTGWDNIHAEFNLARYVRQVTFGAWLEHGGLGAPAGLAHLAEISRLPILFILTSLLPDNLVRYAFIFLMFTLGGIGMYFYLSKIWLADNQTKFKTWLAAIGATYYLLHVLTLQQFYISFELFTVQFGLLPFLLLTVHRLATSVTPRTILLFIGMQLLIAPTGHTPTLFYFGVLFSLIYAFCIAFQKNKVHRAVKFALLVAALSLVANAYWLLPSFYYSIHHSQYVQKSRENKLFSPESLASIREAGSYENFLRGTQYLFTWKDYSFEKQANEYIFQEWLDHFSSPIVGIALETTGRLTLLGFLILCFWSRKGTKRFAILSMYVFCVTLIWTDTSPLKKLLDDLYQNKTILEVFRNPFTKLSVIFAFVSVVLITSCIESICSYLLKIRAAVAQKYLIPTFLGLTLLSAVVVAWPSFKGSFLNEKLRIQYPEAYQQLYAYLNQRDRNLRVLQLPQQAAVGWEYYDWTFLGKANGYQGMGFLFSGIPQPILNRESDRWSESSDFFYHQLEYSLDNQDAELFRLTLEKFNVDLVVVDETKFEPGKKHDYATDHRLVQAAGLKQVWRSEFLTVYERISDQSDSQIFTPSSITAVAVEPARNVADYVYQHEGNYVVAEKNTALYPFSDLLGRKLESATFQNDGVTVSRTVPRGVFRIVFPGLQEKTYRTPVALTLNGSVLNIVFPKNTITVDTTAVSLPGLESTMVTLDEPLYSLYLFFNSAGVLVTQGKTTVAVIELDTVATVDLTFSAEVAALNSVSDGFNTTVSEPQYLKTIFPDWLAIQSGITLPKQVLDEITLSSDFPVLSIDLEQNPLKNCADIPGSQVSTEPRLLGFRYAATEFGVNCNGYSNEYLSTAYPILLQVTGANVSGRGLKLFVNHLNDASTQPYLLTDSVFDQTLAIQPAAAVIDARSSFAINWETRSFGKQNVSQLSSMQAALFPLHQFAQMKLVPDEIAQEWHQTSLVSLKTSVDAVHQLELTCESDRCMFGLDQSFDDLWLAFSISERRFLPHYHLNGWANAWEMHQSGTIVVFYLPELISLLCISLLLALITLLLQTSKISLSQLFLSIRHNRVRITAIHNKVRRTLTSETTRQLP